MVRLLADKSFFTEMIVRLKAIDKIGRIADVDLIMIFGIEGVYNEFIHRK